MSSKEEVGRKFVAGGFDQLKVRNGDQCAEPGKVCAMLSKDFQFRVDGWNEKPNIFLMAPIEQLWNEFGRSAGWNGKRFVSFLAGRAQVRGCITSQKP